MSWFKEFTGKAGALLDKMDQAAATSLQEVGIATPPKGGSNISKEPGGSRQEMSGDLRISGGGGSGVSGVPYEPTTFQSLNSPSQRGAAVAQVLIGSSTSSTQLTSTPRNRPMSPATYSSGSGKSERKGLDTDDSIFEFLNAPNVGRKSSTHRVMPTSSRPSSAKSGSTNGESSSHQVSPSVAQEQLEEGMQIPLTSIPDEKGEKKDVAICEGGREMEKTEEVDGEAEILAAAQTKEVASSQDEQLAGVGGVAGETSQGAELEAWKQKVSNLELENRLIKREVNALNEELSGVMQRHNEAADVKVHYQSEMQALREQASRADHMIRQLRSHEEDLQASVVARDSQIEVLRNQLSAGDRALAEAKEKLVLSKKEQDR